MINRVSGFLGFFPIPPARLNYEANTERNGIVEGRSATRARKPGKPRNPVDHG